MWHIWHFIRSRYCCISKIGDEEFVTQYHTMGVIKCDMKVAYLALHQKQVLLYWQNRGRGICDTIWLNRCDKMRHILILGWKNLWHNMTPGDTDTVVYQHIIMSRLSCIEGATVSMFCVCQWSVACSALLFFADSREIWTQKTWKVWEEKKIFLIWESRD